MKYSAFNVSNFSFKVSKLFIIILYRADFFFYIVNNSSFLVITQKDIYPLWRFINFFPVCGYRFFIKTTHIGELFYRQVALFECLFKFLIIHLNTFKKLLFMNYIKIKINNKLLFDLTIKLLFIYNFHVKGNYLLLITKKEQPNEYSKIHSIHKRQSNR